jgi:hypothetical protein
MIRNSDYDSYLYNHINNVRHGYEWIKVFVPQDKISKIFPDLNYFNLEFNIVNHDKSKYSPDEYKAYNDYFYGSNSKSKKILDDFNKAWLHHIHQNKHHWQYWCLITDDGDKTVKEYKPIGLDIPDDFIVEMICDWWAFSWQRHFELNTLNTNDPIAGLYEIFDWYNEHRNAIIFSTNTRKKVENFLDLLKDTIDKQCINDWTIDTKLVNNQ